MMELNDLEFIARLKKLGIQLSHREDKLLVSAPTGIVDAGLRTELTRRKPSLIELLARGADASRMVVERVEEDASLAPLSFAQQRLWLLDRIFPASAAYNIPEAFVFESAVDATVLQEAVDNLLQRHTILTATILDIHPEPKLRLGAVKSISVETTDLSDIDSTMRMTAVLRLIREEGARPFDLKQAPLIRAHLYRLAPQHHVVFVNVHHILADRWSMQIIRRELTAMYRESATHEPAGLTPLVMQYAEYARQERAFLQSNSYAVHVEYWKNQLKGAPTLLELPISGSRPAVQSFAGAVHPIAISGDLYECLKRIALRENCSLFMTLLAGFATLIYRYTGSRDFLIGSPVSGRNVVETEPLVGLFVNTLVLRLRADPHVSFRELLRSVRDTVLEAHENRDVPFQILVEELKPERNLGSSPFFQIMFALDSETGPVESGNVQLDAYSGISKFDLTLQLTDHSTGMSGVFEYRTDLFEAAKIESLATHFHNLLESIASRPDAPLGNVELLSEEERDLLLHKWNTPSEAHPNAKTIHELFENQVAANPDSIALVVGDARITYADLNQRANRLAHLLIRMGAGPEILIGVCLPRTEQMIIAILAVLKSGSAYVPLDPTYPKQRIAYMFQDSRLKICIAQSSLPIADFHLDANVVVLDRETSNLAHSPISDPNSEVGPSNVAYVIYTSGSTGSPKGVVIEHRNTLALLGWARNQFSPEVLSGVLASTSICFDLSVFEITLLNTVPSALAALLRIYGLPAAIQVVNSAGEFLSPELVDRTYASGNVQQFFDLYGPSETTTYSTFALRERNAPATIGRPITGTRIYLLDTNRQLVPPGLPGEIYIAGQGVARGYLNRAELTAERFVDLPHLGERNRTYKTGDLARYLPDGKLEYLGRIDQQIKLRGHRIELGEIECSLQKQPHVHDAIALVKTQTAPLDDMLIAYVVTDAPIQIAPLLESLRAELPAYMIPSKVLEIDKFPRTPNGKVDRRALAAATTLESQHHAFRAPRTRVERQLLHIWEYCFQRDHIGIDDNFFEIGGHSFLASLVFAEIEKRMGKRLMLAVIFQSPTIELLAKQIDRGGWQPTPSSIVPISAAGSSAALYAVEAEPGSRTGFKKLARVLGPAQPLFGIHTAAESRSIGAGKQFAVLAEDVLVFQPRGPYFICGMLNDSLPAFSLAQQLGCRASDVTLILLDPPDEPAGHAANTPLQSGTASSALLRRLNPLRSSRDEQLSAGFSGRIAIVCAASRAERVRSFWMPATSGALTVESYQDGRGATLSEERAHTFAAVTWKLLA